MVLSSLARQGLFLPVLSFITFQNIVTFPDKQTVFRAMEPVLLKAIFSSVLFCLPFSFFQPNPGLFSIQSCQIAYSTRAAHTLPSPVSSWVGKADRDKCTLRIQTVKEHTYSYNLHDYLHRQIMCILCMCVYMYVCVCVCVCVCACLCVCFADKHEST